MTEDPLERIEREEREKKSRNGGLKTAMIALAVVAVALAGTLAWVWNQKSGLVNELEDEKAELRAIAGEYERAIEKADDKETIIELDEKFHNFIVKCSGNETLSELVRYVQELSLRFRYLYYDDFSLYESTAEQHNRIMEAINAGRDTEARAEADAHVKALKEFVFELGKKMESMGDAE